MNIGIFDSHPPFPPSPTLTGCHLNHVIVHVHCACAMCNVHCALCIVHVYCALCNVQCAMCNVQCALCIVQCALCNVQCALCISNAYLLASRKIMYCTYATYKFKSSFFMESFFFPKFVSTYSRY